MCAVLKVWVLLIGLAVCASLGAMPGNLLIDDFSSRDGRAAIGTAWQGFTDRVMGGLSDVEVGYRDGGSDTVLAMQGRVRLENNGGFIQVRLPLDRDNRLFDARAWQGLRLRVRGEPGSYYLHLRSRDTRAPWAYYAAPVPVEADWQDVTVPFSAFEPQSLRQPLDLTGLRSIAVVAYGQAFEAAIEIDFIEFVAADPGRHEPQ